MYVPTTVASADIGVVSLDTKLTPELVEDGWFREVLSKVQATRKDLDLDYTARIKISASGPARVVSAIKAREAALKQEVLAKEVSYDQSIGGEKRELSLDDQTLVLEILALSTKPKPA